jgi:hypothetical protein
MTAAQKVAKAYHDYAKYMGHGHCGSRTCVECA